MTELDRTAITSTTGSGGLNERTIPVQELPEARNVDPELLRREFGFRSISCVADFEEWRTIGLGGMGVVCEVRERGLNRRVAVKLLRPKFRQNHGSIQRFVSEAKVTAQIDHPNIVPVHQIGVLDDAGVYFSMKRVEGSTLRSLLSKLEHNAPGFRRKYTLTRLLEIFIAACNGVAAAHRTGFIHCDLKPSNLMIGEFGEVMVMDWGVARRPGEKILNDKGEPMPLGGTPVYMAPEHVTGELREPDQLTDVYGLGIILYAILTWKPAPFDSSLPQEKLMPLVAAGKITPLRSAVNPAQPLPQELEAVCLKALSRNRNNRYPSVTALLEDVRNYLDEYPVSAYSPNIWYRGWKKLIRRPLLPVAIMTGLLTGIGYFIFSSFQDYRKEESLRALAGYNYARGTESLQLLQLRLNRAAPGDPLQTPPETRLMNALLDTSNSFSAALDLLSRLSKQKRDNWCIQTSANIFKHLLYVYLFQENIDMAERLLLKGRSQWQELLEDALAFDPELATLTRRLDYKLGVMVVNGPGGTPWRYSLLRHGVRVPDEDGNELPERKLTMAPRTVELPAGEYQLLFRNGKSFTYLPVSVAAGVVRVFRFSLPEKLPEGMAFVPAGEFLQTPRRPFQMPLRRKTGSFLIARKELTFGEYLEFWRSLPQEKRKEFTLQMVAKAGNPARNLWDENGKLLPGLAPELPLFGASVKEAHAYCAWLSKKTGYKIRLPHQEEWEKAFRGSDGRVYPWGNIYRRGYALLRDSSQGYPFGAPAGTFAQDLSPYGVQDLCGSVMELLEPRYPGDEERAIGGSRLGSRNNLSPEKVAPGAWDVGFRYLMEL